MTGRTMNKTQSFGRRLPALLTGAALGALAIAHPAYAVGPTELPTGGNVVAGNATQTQTGNKLDINQSTDKLYMTWHTYNIGQNATVEYFQPGAGSIAVNKVIGTGFNPARILGNLKSNGKVVVLDQDGVVFGPHSRVDVGGIVASTGNIDQNAFMNGNGKLAITDLSQVGNVINYGTISAKDGGLVAFVAPTVINNGVINAKMGKVALAGGTAAATVDLYGDGLVELAPGGKSAKVLASNAGVINAEGGTIAMTASAARSAVDDVISMDGIANASSFSQKGGDIVLSSDGGGKIDVKGTLNASGEGGGTVTVKGKAVDMKGLILADGGLTGNGGKVTIKSTATARLSGLVSAQGGMFAGDGGQVELSGNMVGYTGMVNTLAPHGATGTFLLDPVDMVIGNKPGTQPGALDQPYVNAQDIANTLGYTNVNLKADNSITVAENIDVSTYFLPATQFLQLRGTSGKVVFPIGITSNDLTMTAATVNLAHDITLGTGKLTVDAGTLNLNGKVSSRSILFAPSTIVTDPNRLDATGTVNVQSASALINQGLAFARSGHTVHVGAGTYDEDVVMNDANVTLAGAGGNLSTVTPHSPGIVVNGNGDTVIGMAVYGGSTGILVQNANGVTVADNDVRNTTGDGILFTNSKNGTADGNYVANTGPTGNGIAFEQGSDNGVISQNIVHITGRDGIRSADSAGMSITSNNVTKAAYVNNADFNDFAHAISLENGSGDVSNNTINGTGGDGVYVAGDNGVTVMGNTVTNFRRYGIGSVNSTNVTIGQETSNPNVFSNIVTNGINGIYVEGGNNVMVDKNIVNQTRGAGLQALNVGQSGPGAHSVTFYRNYVDGGNVGIDVGGSAYASVTNNHVRNMTGAGVTLDRDNNAQFIGNLVTDTGAGAVDITNSRFVTANFNRLYRTGGNGFSLDNANNAVLSGNFIGSDNDGVSKGTGNIRGNGIVATNLRNITVQGNTIQQTVSVDPTTGSGVLFKNVTNGLIGGTGAGQGNVISHSGYDNVTLNSTNNVTVQDNVLSSPTRVNVYADNSNVTHIFGNTATGAQLRGYGAIWGEGDTNLIIDGNAVSNGRGYGILVTNGAGFSTVINNVVNGMGKDGIRVVNASRVGVGGNTIGTSGPGSIGGDGIYMGNISGVSSANGNTIANVANNGIEVQTAGVPLTGRTSSMTIDGNTITRTGNDGILVNGVNGPGNSGGGGIILAAFRSLLATNGGLEVDGNVIGQDGAGSIGNNGIEVGNVGTADISSNRVANSFLNGIMVSDADTSTVNGNIVTNSGANGLFAAGPGIGSIAVGGNTFTDNQTGAAFESGTIDLTGAGNTFNGGQVGYYFAPFATGFDFGGGAFRAADDFPFPGFPFPTTYAPMSLVNDTIGTAVFNGQSNYYVQLNNGAFFEPGEPTKLNGNDATYDGFRPSSQNGPLTTAQDTAINAKIFDYRDDPTLGLFFPLPGTPGGPVETGGGTPIGGGGTAGDLVGEEQIFHYFNGFLPPVGALRVTITGLPRTGGVILPSGSNPGSLAGITPGAGGPDANDVANIEPAAGGNGRGSNHACWSDAVQSVGQGPVNVNFGSGLTQSLSDISTCRGTL